MTYYISTYPTRMVRRMMASPAVRQSAEHILAVNVREEQDAYILSALVPGLKAEDLNIQVLDAVLSALHHEILVFSQRSPIGDRLQSMEPDSFPRFKLFDNSAKCKLIGCIIALHRLRNGTAHLVAQAPARILEKIRQVPVLVTGDKPVVVNPQQVGQSFS